MIPPLQVWIPLKKHLFYWQDFCQIDEENVPWGRGGGVLPYKGLMGTCSQSGDVIWDFCHKRTVYRIFHYCLCLKQGIFSWQIS